MSISYWSTQCAMPEFSSLDGNIQDECVVIGAGIAGLTTAYLLLKEGASVTLVSDGTMASGETRRTTGHLTCMLDLRFFELEALFGKEGVLLSLKSHSDAVDQIEKICKAENIECDFERLESHLFQESEFNTDLLAKEFDTLQRVGFANARLEKSPFSFFVSEKMLTFRNQAQFHPLKYVQGLVSAILRLKGKFYTNTHIVEIQGGKDCHAKTDTHHHISAKALIIATNTPINNRFIMHTKQAPYRTYACAAKIPKNSVHKGLFYDTLDPYHYVRIFEEDQADVLIIGGEDHKTGQENHCKRRYQHLEAWAKKRFPMISEFTHFWSGQILEPVDSIGFIGRNPFEENIYIITGHSGNGLTYGTLGGMITRDLIYKKPSEFETFYSPGRITWGAAGEFLKENFNVGKEYTKWLRPPLEHRLGDLAKDAGKVVQNKVAVYRDQDGQCHEMSAICPHLGCIVSWNDAEKTWDCPCHGSRFECNGKVICGPATENLKTITKVSEPL